MYLCLQFVIPDVSTRISEGYIALKIQRDDGGGFVDISAGTTRPPLRDVVSRYVYQDSTGSTAWSYQAVLVNEAGGEYGTVYAASSLALNTYTTLQDVRDEGVSDTVVSDARVESFIEVANRYIEQYTQNWFNARFQIFELTGDDDKRLFLDIPIIALQKVAVDGAEEGISNLEVNNRYLRNGLTSPDDRKNPMITYSEGYLVDNGERLLSLGGGAFPRYRQKTKIWGVFGFTELPRGTVCGETSTNSQVPLEYGDVPELIKWCATTIAVTRCFPMLSDEATKIVMKNRIEKLKTRDQEVYFSSQDPSEIMSTKWFTNSTVVDDILASFKRPVKMRFV